MRRLLLLIGAAVVLTVGLVLVRTVRYGSVRPEPARAPGIIIPAAAAERLAGALRLRTLAREDPAPIDAEPFRALHHYLETAFPKVHARIEREIVASHSLLYTWRGSDPALEPILLMGHLDVVPVDPATEREWRQEPFGGRVADGFVWGRGAIDNKSAVLGILEAAEMLLDQDFRPARTVHLAFGHDEEVGGNEGARVIAAVLKQRGVTLQLVLDEGGVIGAGLLPGIAKPVALVGIAEKGFVSIELLARAPGGHSSLPPAQTAIGILGAAVSRLEATPIPARLEGATRLLFDRLAPELSFVQRAAFANAWLTGPFLLRRLAGQPATNAMIRTTGAPTVIQGGNKDNVLPGQARAVINYRILPGDSIAAVLAHVRSVVEDPRVEVRASGAFAAEPSRISSTGSSAYVLLERTIRSVFPDTLVAPFQVVVATDARHYEEIGRDIFRFQPLRLAPEDLGRIHGIDERIAVSDYENAVRAYVHLIRDAAAH